MKQEVRFMRTLILVFLLFGTIANAEAKILLEINCMGAEADVFVNGEEVGECPITVKVSPGEHNIIVKREFSDGSYYHYSKTTKVSKMVEVKKLPVYLVRKKGDEYYFRKTTSGDPNDFEYYIKKYPNGKHIQKVKKELERIYFIKCRTVEKCNLYLRKYPNGKYVKEANEKIEKIIYTGCESSRCFKRYLELFPDGLFYEHAHQKLNNIQYTYAAVYEKFTLALREGPISTSKIIGIVDSKKGLELLEYPGTSYTKVKSHDGQVGYVKNTALTLPPFHSCRGPCYEQYIKGSLIYGRDQGLMPLLKKPGDFNSGHAGTVQSAEQLEIIEQKDEWSKVQKHDGKIGWISKRATRSQSEMGKWCLDGDCVNGSGKFRSPLNCQYEGGFKHGLKHGKGIYTWPNGTQYVGAFFLGNMHGEGKMYYFDGTTEDVNYENGKLKQRSSLK